jgi:hypothetical protein
MAILAGLGRCIRLLAQIADKKQKFLSNPTVQGLFTVETALQNADRRDINKVVFTSF